MSYTSAEQETKHVDPSCTSYDYYSILRTVSEHTEKQGVRKMIEAMITPTSQHKEGDKVTVFLSLTHYKDKDILYTRRFLANSDMG